MANSIFGIAAAIVGAGFASGREIMQFFSQYGALSWVLILFSGILMTALIHLLLCSASEEETEKQSFFIHILFVLLYGAVSSGMTAAAGELAALTIPIHHARLLGMAATLAVCVKLSGGSARGIAVLGKILVPAMAGVFLLCMRIPVHSELPDSLSWISVFQAAGYCGMNAVLSAPVAALAGRRKTRKERACIAIGSGIVFGALLALGNAALLPYGAELKEAALPMVVLLRDYGKAGFYLSAAVLYLAVATTLIASLRGLEMWVPGKRKGVWAVLIAAGGALAGFQEIVGRVYPVLGYICLVKLLFQKQTKAASRKRKKQAECG